MSETTPDHWTEIEQILRLFFPQFFDEDGPHYVDPEILMALAEISEDARPWCLRDSLANTAQAMFIAYLVSFRTQTMTGTSHQETAGPVVSEKEGDITVQYADLSKTGTNQMSKKPPSDPWDAWNRLYMRCAMGAILTRFGDPVKSGLAVTAAIVPLAVGIWQR